MIPFREKNPTRRSNPSKKQSGQNWQAHKAELREDFNKSCGYCDAYDDYRHTYYEVDHFVPKDFCKKDKVISLAQYNNLVYSCKFCSLSKRALWPSNSATVFNDGVEGFVDPCDASYTDHFERTDDGMIMWKTDLGKWMYQKAFKFDERAAGIRLLYNIRQLDKTIRSLRLIQSTFTTDSEDFKTIEKKVAEYSVVYHKTDQELRNFYG